MDLYVLDLKKYTTFLNSKCWFASDSTKRLFLSWLFWVIVYLLCFIFRVLKCWRWWDRVHVVSHKFSLYLYPFVSMFSGCLVTCWFHSAVICTGLAWVRSLWLLFIFLYVELAWPCEFKYNLAVSWKKTYEGLCWILHYICWVDSLNWFCYYRSILVFCG